MPDHAVELRQALEASERAYGLLIWLGELVNSGRITVDDARNALSSGEDAIRFLNQHHDGLPAKLAPADIESGRLTGNLLGSYLRVSFELLDEPEVWSRSDPACGGNCPWCREEVTGSHLKTKQLIKSDKSRADSATRFALRHLISDLGVSPDDEVVEGFIRSYPEEASVLAYAESLVARADGISPGTTALALWRRFAWRGGSPRKSFQLNLELIAQARTKLLDTVSTWTPNWEG